ncbi:uncharacterized protein LOC136081761 [Hydra vulgaris]|uniref:Uncharacterized protein LOC136081761 n=1 Tax=Hydra vulgaris TaxID=6087 RepID=A0ABM4C2V0_HYDVU
MEQSYPRRLSEPPPYYQAAPFPVQQQPDDRFTPQYQNSNQSQQFYPSVSLIGNVPYRNPYHATTNQLPAEVNIRQLPSNYNTAAWLTCFFCCCPLGLMSIIKSNEVNKAILLGDITRAQLASQSAKQYALAAVICGMIIIIIAVVLIFFAPR